MTQDRFRRLLPLVLATMATQASIVVLAPIIVAIGRRPRRLGQRGRPGPHGACRRPPSRRSLVSGR